MPQRWPGSAIAISVQIRTSTLHKHSTTKKRQLLVSYQQLNLSPCDHSSGPKGSALTLCLPLKSLMLALSPKTLLPHALRHMLKVSVNSTTSYCRKTHNSMPRSRKLLHRLTLQHPPALPILTNISTLLEALLT